MSARRHVHLRVRSSTRTFDRRRILTATHDLRFRGCLQRDRTNRELLAQHIYDRCHPAFAGLGVLFLVLVLAQAPVREGTALQVVLLSVTWALWAVFVGEDLLRLVIAPSTGAFLKRTWWQILLLAVPVLMLGRALLLLRIARPTRVTLAAVRSGRSARATVAGRTACLGLPSTIVIFSSADLLYELSAVRPYGAALHAAALGAITGEPIGSNDGVAQLLDVVLALYAVVFFAALAGITGAFLFESKRERTTVE